jgi:hypothetical protein
MTSPAGREEGLRRVEPVEGEAAHGGPTREPLLGGVARAAQNPVEAGLPPQRHRAREERPVA